MMRIAIRKWWQVVSDRLTYADTGTATQGLFPLGKGSALMPGHTNPNRISFFVLESICATPSPQHHDTTWSRKVRVARV